MDSWRMFEWMNQWGLNYFNQMEEKHWIANSPKEIKFVRENKSNENNVEETKWWNGSKRSFFKKMLKLCLFDIKHENVYST